MKQKIAIIGAGPGGLAAGMLLQYAGYQVTIYEKQAVPGGRTSGFSVGDFRFDRGPTFFVMPGILEEIFRSIGRSLSDYVKKIPLDPLYRLSFPGDRHFYPSPDPEKMRKELDRFFPRHQQGFSKYLKREKKKYQHLLPCIRRSYTGVLDFFHRDVFRAIPHMDLFSSLQGVLGKYFKDEDLKNAFSFQAKYIGMSAWQAPGLFSFLSYAEHSEGIFHIEGGLHRLSERMAALFAELGGSIHYETAVRQILVKQRKAKGILLENGEKIDADAVVINADFAEAMTTLVDESDRRKYSDRKLASMHYSCSTFMIYLGLDRIYDNIPHHNFVFGNDYKGYVESITRQRHLETDLSFYIQNPAVTDSSLAPEGKSALYVLVPVVNNFAGLHWESIRSQFRDRVIEVLETRCGFNHLSKHIVCEQLYTPDDWESQLDVYRGATFNLGHQLSQMILFRPHNRFEEFDNTYLVGGGTQPGSGLPTIFESARITSKLIRKDLPV